MNFKLILIVFGAVILFFGISSSYGMGINMLPIGLGFCLLMIGLCMKNPKKEMINDV